MLIHWIWLSTRPGMQEREQLAVLSAFRDPEEIFYAEKEAYTNVMGVTAQGIAALCDKDLSEAKGILDECIRKNIQICTFHDGAYPVRLKNIADPPLVLYYQGNLAGLDSAPVIGVVGTRKASAYGLTSASRIGYQIARCGGIVVSGLASGIDANAMTGALTAGGSIVGVLGCGIDVVYPVTSRSLYLDTQRNGCLISEFPPNTPPHKWNFPKRNRIISGLSNGVVVVEAPVKSGALITARRALDQGRDVFVVPGNIDVDNCKGSNGLLREGAMAVSSGWDVVSEYVALYPDKIRMEDEALRLQPEIPMKLERDLPKVAQNVQIPGAIAKPDRKKEKKPIDKGEKKSYSVQQDIWETLTPQEQELLRPLQDGEILVDNLIAQSGLPAGKVLSMLTMLQIRGVVELLPGKRVSLK